MRPAPIAARVVGAALAPYTLLALDDADGITRHIAHAGGPLAACEAALVALDQADRATGFDVDAALSSARVGAARLIAAALETDAAHLRAALVVALGAVRELCQAQRRRRGDHARIRAAAERLTGRTLGAGPFAAAPIVRVQDELVITSSSDRSAEASPLPPRGVAAPAPRRRADPSPRLPGVPCAAGVSNDALS